MIVKNILYFLPMLMMITSIFFYTDNTYNEYKMLNVIFGTYEIINDNYIVKEITEELRKKKAVAIFQEVMKGLKK